MAALRLLALSALLASLAATVLVIRASPGFEPEPAMPPVAAESAARSAGPPPVRTPRPDRPRRRRAPIRLASVALGTPGDGALRNGVLLPAAGRGWITWDPILSRHPNRAWRRHGADRLVALLRRVARRWAQDHPGAPPLVVGDLSRPRGGDFGPRYGIVGHASHQNGLDADVSYPRRDGRARPPGGFAEADRSLSRELVRRFVAAGAALVYVTPALGRVAGHVEAIGGHEGHLHVRISD